MAYHVDLVCDRHEEGWRAGRRTRIEDVLNQGSKVVRLVLLRELLAAELTVRQERGECPLRSEYLDRFPGEVELIEAIFAEAGLAAEPAAILDKSTPGDGPKTGR
jgi:hypothetical protein